MCRRRDLLRRLDRVWELLIVWSNVRSSQRDDGHHGRCRIGLRACVPLA